MTKEIPIGKTGLLALVDDDDYDVLSRIKWSLKKKRRKNGLETSYVAHDVIIEGSKKRTFMHRLIMRPFEGEIVDHENHNTLDNRRENLRVCTHAQSAQNRRKLKKTETSPYKGVKKYSAKSGLWMAYIRSEKILHVLGFFETPEAAARAYDEAALKYHGEFACLNFPGNAA